MDGIIFLSAEEVVKTTSAGAAGFVITFFFFLLLGIVMGGIWALFVQDTDPLWISLVVCLAFGLIFGIFGACVEVETERTTEYKVFVQDEEALPYLIENYEIIDKDGDVYTIREKNNADK